MFTGLNEKGVKRKKGIKIIISCSSKITVNISKILSALSKWLGFYSISV